jgi:5,10-methylenetetrahydromethanopterin reductase
MGAGIVIGVVFGRVPQGRVIDVVSSGRLVWRRVRDSSAQAGVATALRPPSWGLPHGQGEQAGSRAPGEEGQSRSPHRERQAWHQAPREEAAEHEERPRQAAGHAREDVILPRFGLNRFDSRSVGAFAADVARAEALGWDAALQPDSQLRRRDTYVLLAAAAQATSRITLGPLLANPINRHPTVTAGSIATVDELAPGRVILGFGVGDTAVRLAGLRPARVKELEDATGLMRALLDGQEVEVGAARPARLPHHRPVPIWIAAGGPRTLRMAGGVADGVFIRVGTHAANLATAVQAIRAGAREAGRDPQRVRLGAVFHTVLVDDEARALTMAKSMAAGYFEYSPALFDPPGLRWNGPDPERLKHERSVWPDFHHAPDLEASGRAVDFLPTAAADAFALRGGPAQVAEQLISTLRACPAPFDYVVLHPIPDPRWPDEGERGYTARMAREVLPVVRKSLA